MRLEAVSWLCLSTWADNHSATVFSCGVSDLEMAHSIHVWFFFVFFLCKN